MHGLLLACFFHQLNCDKCSFPSRNPPVCDRYSSACARNVASFLKGVTYRDGSAAVDLQQMLGLEKGLQNAQKGSALTSMFQPALLLQDSCESSENLKADVLDETGKIDPFCSQCMYVVGFSGLNTFHLMYTLLPLRCINLSKKPVQTIPTLPEANSRNCAHSHNHECVRAILPEFYAVISSS